jgi:hypothetical protein
LIGHDPLGGLPRIGTSLICPFLCLAPVFGGGVVDLVFLGAFGNAGFMALDVAPHDG